MDALSRIARDLTIEHFGNSLRVGGYFLYDPRGKAKSGKGRPIKVIDGQFMSGGRLSNFWYWRRVDKDGSLNKKTFSGYGGDKNYFKPISRSKAIQLAKSL